MEGGSNSAPATNSLIGGWEYAGLILLIIVIAGAIGGIAAYYLNDTENNSKCRSVTLGISAAFIVPVLLNMISSNLLEKAHIEIHKLFVFAGFCVLAAVFSRNFLENIYNKVLQQVGNINDKVKQIEEANEEPDATEVDDPAISTISGSLTKDQIELLKAFSMGRFTYRSITGLTKDSKLERITVEQCLNKLMTDQLVDSKLNDKKQMRYFLSGKGRQFLGSLE